MKKIAFLIFAVVAIFATSCNEEPISTPSKELGEGVTVALNLTVEQMQAGTPEAAAQLRSEASAMGEATTRAAAEPSKEIKNLWVMQFDEKGQIIGKPTYIEDYEAGVSFATITPSEELEHTMAFVANTFNANFIQNAEAFSISHLRALSYAISDVESNFTTDGTQQYAVLFGSQTEVITLETKLDAVLIRNIAKVNINIRVANGVDLTFTNAAMRGVPDKSYYFPSTTAGEEFPLQWASEWRHYSDVALVEDATSAVSDYQTITFYLPVNKRGSVTNTDELLKNQYGNSYCTSIVLTATSGGKNYEYNIYLGENLINDFNIEANHHYTYNLEFNTVGDPQTDLRVTTAGGVDFTPKTISRSNCYILNPSIDKDNTYYIPIDRIDEFWGNPEYNTANITGNTLAEIGDNWEIVTLWSDHNGDFAFDETTGQLGALKLEKDNTKKAVKVTLPKEFAASRNHCNVLYGVRKVGETDLLWSWHLWITDYDPYPGHIIPSVGIHQYPVPGGELHRYDNAAFDNGIYSEKMIMDRNLGARDGYFDGHQYSLYYQFGRKDPFPNNYSKHNSEYAYSRTLTQRNLAYSVNKPNILIYTSNWCSDGGGDDVIWNDYKLFVTNYIYGKSIFDPSPLGFRLPIDNTWDGFSGSYEAYEENPNNTWDNFLLAESITPFPEQYRNGRLYKGYAYYSNTGYYNGFRDVRDYNSRGHYWTALPSSATTAYKYYLETSAYGPRIDYLMGTGYCLNIRPVQE